MYDITTLDEANDAVENGLLVKVSTNGVEGTKYYTTSEDGWQEGYRTAAGTVGHEVVDVSTVREAIVDALKGDGSVTAVKMDDSPWGKSRHVARGAAI